MECVNACKTSALVRAGYWKTVDEVLRAILEYNLFYTYSDRGGITLSGGEPTYQPDFASELLKACKKNGIHTAIETSGYCEHTALKKTVENCDLVLYDIKHMDEETHRGFTSRGNRLILDNLRMLVADDRIRDYVIRVPLIVGFNDSQENICETAEFVSSLRKVEHVDLLPFNELAIAKYNALGLRWRYENIKRQSEATLKILRECVEPYGLKVTIGGLW
jgi:pyruvate formate lyase activating enzyme